MEQYHFEFFKENMLQVPKSFLELGVSQEHDLTRRLIK
jgi:hypothetical protein